MTKLEAIQHLTGQNNEIIVKFAQTWEDSKVVRLWNHLDQMDAKGLKIVNTSEGEFEIEFYAPLCDFFKAAWNNTLNN
jgi:hypothetical protein